MAKKLTLTCMLMFIGVGTIPLQGALSDGLVSYFKLDEGSGTVAADSSGNGNDGTLFGNEAQWVPGRFGGAVLFSTTEVEAHVEFPTTGMSVTAGTISVWGWLGDPQASRTRYFFGHTTRPPYSNRIQIYMDGGTTNLDVGLGDTHARRTDMLLLPTKTWVHVVLTWNNGQYIVYVGGEKIADGTYTGLTALDPVANISDDDNPNESEAFDGMLDEVRIYNRAITAAEVKEIFQVPASPRIKAWGPSPADGAKDVTAPLFTWKSVDTIKLHDIYLGTSPDLTAADLVAPRQPLKLYYHAPGLQPGATYYWRVDEIDADMVTVHTGDVWSFMAQPFTAYDPQPADGTNTAPSVIDLRWLKGIGALKHHVYFGDDREAVTQGAAGVDQGIFADPNYSPGDLESAKTYYWRVDEVGAGEVVKTGQVWSFTTVVPVDDFESYTDEEGSRIYETWIDGWTNGTGSVVGNLQEPFAERTTTYHGGWSIPMDYNNVNSPWYSETEREFSPVQNWTVQGVDTLTLYYTAGPLADVTVQGLGPLYVGVQDSAGRTAVFVHPSPDAVRQIEWQRWDIPLADVSAAGVNTRSIKKMFIGVGDRDKPQPDGAGRICIDAIRLTKGVPVQPTPAP